MALLKIIHYPDPVLLKVGMPVTEFDADLEKLADDMFETLANAEAVGLAAPQVAVSKRLLVMDCSARRRSFAQIDVYQSGDCEGRRRANR